MFYTRQLTSSSGHLQATRIAASLCGLCFILASAPAAAETESRASCRADAGYTVLKPELFSWAADSPTTMVQTCYADNSSQTSIRTSGSKGSASADHGILKSFAGIQNDGSNTSGEARSSAMFADNPVLSAPGHEGERLLVTFKMSFAASYFHEGNSLGGMNLYFRSESSGPDFSTFASLELRRGWDFDGSPFVSDVLVPSGWGPGIAIGTDSFSISLGALGGSTIPLSVKLSTVVFLFGDGDVYVDAGNSAYWSGANVTTLDGQAVAFTLVGKNGIDYSQPITTVDEPQAAMTLSAGIALIAFMRRKRDGRVTRK